MRACRKTRAIDYLVKPLQPARPANTVAQLKRRLLALAAAGTLNLAALRLLRKR